MQTDIKNLKLNELTFLCESLRTEIINTVLKCGGHLSSNLGIVELTVALHYVFDFPKDKLVFDVGHQCYAHKILSGRGDRFNTLRKKGGLSGFPKREESDYDCYNTGHAGTSVSAALGLAKARDINGEDYEVIALIGDGSFNNGLVYEAFNSLKLLNSRILVIINDNGMSISPTVGSMHDYLFALENKYDNVKNTEKRADVFEHFGFEYDGVYDGNDVALMVERLLEVKQKLKTSSVILHVCTKKGKGYSFCEENPEATHGVSSKFSEISESEYSQIFGKTLIKVADENKKIVAVTAAMTGALGLNEFFEKYPDRSIDVGICEEHASVLCASMASQGLKPYYAIYSTFLQRAFDEIVIDICSQNLPVTLCIDRAGISGADGETHQGVFDLSYLSMIPNLTVAVPKDVNEFVEMINFSANYDKPLAIRYPREGKRVFGTTNKICDLSWERLVEGDGRYVILATGERAMTCAVEAIEQLLTEGIAITLINARFVKPLDENILNGLNEKVIITVEDNVKIGGFGSLINSYFSEKGKTVKNFGYGDKFIYHGGVKELMSEYGVSTDRILNFIRQNENRQILN